MPRALGDRTDPLTLVPRAGEAAMFDAVRPLLWQLTRAAARRRNLDYDVNQVEDLFGDVTLIALGAIRRWDEAGEANLATFVRASVRKWLIVDAGENLLGVRVPGYVHGAGAAGSYARAARDRLYARGEVPLDFRTQNGSRTHRSEPFEVTDPRPAPAPDVEQAEDRARLERYLGSLDALPARVLRARFGGLSVAAAAACLGCSREEVRRLELLALRALG